MAKAFASFTDLAEKRETLEIVSDGFYAELLRQALGMTARSGEAP
ncbi:hypothetical protein [Niveispirillum sp.]|nr:hypothetical protein [Niveispirillum sp.]